ncbi:M24 family metallopeptidase [Labrys monachus]|uniref:Xaa-Pro aminopeptidase n=1 Tax=Labrys monachus TaxID=217067 RepID=A0ABU0F9Y0_9HYPH|nr:Xaa-Pro peptidase family protein [Labrys monachus]MDQ0391341.1 Xaa-Pro aminopeptidase [Labrys monachus]
MKTSFNELVNSRRLNDRMDALGLDALVARSGANFTYLAGFAYPGTLARHVDLPDSPRAVFLLWPRHGEPRIIVNTIAEGLARRDSWVETFDLYEGYVERPVERLCTAIEDAGLSGAVVGFERNYISAADADVLAARLPRMRMRDSTAMMEDVRAVKMPGEIALLRQGADILDDAFLEVFPTARPGMRERDLHAALVAACLARGCEFVHGILNSSRNTVSYAGESDFAFEAGDAIRTDYVAYRKGYPGHQSRCAVIGQPTAEQRRDYRTIRDIYLASLDMCRPGVASGDIYRQIVERFEAAGLTYASMLAGHSVGCWWHQQEPVISRGNSRRLESGMVIAMEPHINHWHIQDMILVTGDGPELLSGKFPTDEIFACG